MASVRELKSRWQIRFYDAKREPKRTTNSVRKSNFPTRSKAESEAEWRQQLYDRGEYNPWVQNHPSDTAGQDTVTVGEAVEQYIEDKTRAGERGEPNATPIRTLLLRRAATTTPGGGCSGLGAFASGRAFAGRRSFRFAAAGLTSRIGRWSWATKSSFPRASVRT